MQPLRTKSRHRLIKIPDVVLILILFSAILLIPKKRGKNVEIYVDGRLKFVYPLNIERIIMVKGKLGESIVKIKRGRVRMEESACPLKLCVKQGYISNQGEEIICVPNRVVIRIIGGKLDCITE